MKMTSRRQNRHTDVMHESCLTPSHVRQHFLAPVWFTKILIGYARKRNDALIAYSYMKEDSIIKILCEYLNEIV